MYRIVIILAMIFISCSPKNNTWMGKKVTERKFNRKLDRYTKKFIKKHKDLIEQFSDFEIIYDTSKPLKEQVNTH